MCMYVYICVLTFIDGIINYRKSGDCLIIGHGLIIFKIFNIKILLSSDKGLRNSKGIYLVWECLCYLSIYFPRKCYNHLYEHGKGGLMNVTDIVRYCYLLMCRCHN